MKEHKEIVKNHKLRNQGVICEMQCVAVHKDYKRRGIGGILTNLLVENAKKQGYWMCFAECTSAYSTKALENHGAKTEFSIDYKTYSHGGSTPFADTITEPHTKANLVVFRLK